LDVLFTTEMPITPAHLAWVVHVPVAEAERHLEQMVESSILQKECDLETGAVSYVYPQRSLLAWREPADLVKRKPEPSYSPSIAAWRTFVMSGAGYFYSGREKAGILWMIATLLGYLCFVVPGLVLHVLCIASASRPPRALIAGGR